MSKSLLNQRYIYKLSSKYLAKNKYTVELSSVANCIKDRFAVSWGNSQAIRFIEEITNRTDSEYKIVKIKEDIKRLSKEISKVELTREEKKKLKKELNKLIKKKNELMMEDNICVVVFETTKQYKRITEKGFTINGKKFKFILGTAGGIKQNSVVFVSEEVSKELDKRIMNGYNEEVPMVVPKLMSYKALTFSTSTPVRNTKNVLVVKDIETSFQGKAIGLKFGEEGQAPVRTILAEKETIEIVNNACDGCGMISPELAELWSMDLQEDYVPSGFCIRNSWTKGMLTKFDYKKYCKEVIGKEEVVDVWGNTHNINNIDIILNQSMLKCWKGYSSIEDYLSNCEKNGYSFAVTKYSPKKLENTRAMNYQYLQCLDLSKEEIEALVEHDIKELEEVLGMDYRKSILFGKGKNLTDTNVWVEGMTEDSHIKALMCNPDCINDEYVRRKIKKAITKRINQLKTGKVEVSANFQIAVGEPVIQLESMFGLEPKGLLQAEEFYIEYWRDKGVDLIGAFRSPMSCKENARKRTVCNREEVIKWYGDIKNLIVFNAWDTSMMAMNGEDKQPSLSSIN